MNNSIIEDYGLRHYVRDLYVTKSGERGGSIFKPLYKKDKKPFDMRVKCAVNRSKQVIYTVKYAFSKN